jgi:hypothetical protein
VTVGDCSKAETQAFFEERVLPRVPEERRAGLDFEVRKLCLIFRVLNLCIRRQRLYDAFGGKLAHWSDYVTDYGERPLLRHDTLLTMLSSPRERQPLRRAKHPFPPSPRLAQLAPHPLLTTTKRGAGRRPGCVGREPCEHREWLRLPDLLAALTAEPALYGGRRGAWILGRFLRNPVAPRYESLGTAGRACLAVLWTV